MLNKFQVTDVKLDESLLRLLYTVLQARIPCTKSAKKFLESVGEEVNLSIFADRLDTLVQVCTFSTTFVKISPHNNCF